ncbi:uncharacterized protein N7484_000420 [Penicillium longicatenatum]|uniref:uncharacterized protein n=1 Tax=Penicillium longicatenatum TaxID=1561947 RepID=UPI0025472853|nr:uncharacterized protein N7484_000420 [Penicillium longicatenatum]KAJ5661048.1 hypothetical protein N7484_000420 [Penicillium longicatenatum]
MSDISCSPEELPMYYDVGPDWTGVETPEFQAYLGANAYCTEPIGPSALLTPVSLPDSSMRPSPALSHHSEYAPEYQYINNSIAPQGLGITAPFPTDFPVSAPTLNTSYIYAPDELQQLEYGLPTYTSSMSPQMHSQTQAHIPAPRRKRRAPSQSRSHTPSRDTPINILPHPEGIERMERERLNPRPPPQLYPRPRAPGRGRRDPQAEAEDMFVEELREQNTAWKVVRELYRERFDKDASESRLQMRLKRRREQRNTHWEDHDVQLLINASAMWEKEKFRFIADKMKELGASKDYTPDQCKLQLRVIDVKQYYRNMGSASPSAMTDPPRSLKPKSRKRARVQSLDPE